ncbi:MAG: type secretion system secreted protein VgrG [Thermomicrobiales bacterium]|nr:type secretion system secreted protein VgrG [Thermomicrobiales bacterium]
MLRRLSAFALALMIVLLLIGTVPATAFAVSTSTPTTDEVGSLRARPSPRPYDNPNSKPRTGDNVRGSRALETTDEAGPPRLDDAVLRWLPEMTEASNTTGTPISLIAGIMRVESGGDPTITSPQGAQGLMQVMPDELATQGISQEKWLDPPTNVMAGAVILAQRSGNGWESAAAYYFGIGCDYYGTCTYGYAVAIIGWANAYAALLGDPIWYDVGRIPDVPDSPEPTPTPTLTPTPTASSTPDEETSTPPPEPTGEPTNVTTEEPTAVPTDEPTEEPTAVPTDVPTEVPTEEASPDSGAEDASSGDADGTPNS